MKITRVEALHCDAGWRPWTFVRLETDGGLVGWGECSDDRSPHGIAGCVRDLADLLIGQDPRPVERLYFTSLLFVFRAAANRLRGVADSACVRRGRPRALATNTLGAAADVDYDGVAKKAGQVVGFSSVKDSVIDGFSLWS